MTISVKISRAIDKIYRAKFYAPSTLRNCKTVVIVGADKFRELQAEAYSLMVYNFPSPRYTFQGCEVIVDYRPAYRNNATVELRDELTGKVRRKIEIKA